MKLRIKSIKGWISLVCKYEVNVNLAFLDLSQMKFQSVLRCYTMECIGLTAFMRFRCYYSFIVTSLRCYLYASRIAIPYLQTLVKRCYCTLKVCFNLETLILHSFGRLNLKRMKMIFHVDSLTILIIVKKK